MILFLLRFYNILLTFGGIKTKEVAWNVKKSDAQNIHHSKKNEKEKNA